MHYLEKYTFRPGTKPKLHNRIFTFISKRIEEESPPTIMASYYIIVKLIPLAEVVLTTDTNLSAMN